MMAPVRKEKLRVVRELVSGDLPWSESQRSDIYPGPSRVKGFASGQGEFIRHY